MTNVNVYRHLITVNDKLESPSEQIRAARTILRRAETESRLILEGSNNKIKFISKESIKKGYELGRSQGLATLINIPKLKAKVLRECTDLMLIVIETILNEVFSRHSENFFSETLFRQRLGELIENLDLDRIDLSESTLSIPSTCIEMAREYLEREGIKITLKESNENVLSIETEDGTVSYLPEFHLKNILTKVQLLLSTNSILDEIIDKDLEDLASTLAIINEIHD